MESSEGYERSIRELWPLLGLRYLLIVVGVLIWLYEAERTSHFVAGTLLLSFVLVLELFVYGAFAVHGRSAWAAAQLLLGLLGLLFGPDLPVVLIMSAVLAGLAAVAPLGLTLPALGVTGLLTVGCLNGSVALVAVVIGLYLLAFALGRLFRERVEETERHRQLVAQLEEAQQRIAEFAETTRHLAVVQERQQIAEELHDTLGHALVASLLQVQVVSRQIDRDPHGAKERLTGVEEHIRTTLDQVRAALRRGARRRSQLPLHMALESLAADFSAAGGPRVELLLRPDPESVSEVAPDVAEVLYRTAQEALTNAVRHGAATRIVVEAEAVGSRLYLRISDNGVGAEQYTPGMGLTGMVRRVQAIGGTLRFATAKEEGFRVEVGVKRR